MTDLVKKNNMNCKEKCLCSLLFIIYLFITIIMIFKHEAWFDETQAWNIARDLSPFEIIDFMKYEGHSSLWHFILYPFAHLGFPFETIGFISVFFMSLAVFLLLFKSPFPIYMKLCVIFSAGFIYINVTVARVYAIIPLILFLIAIVYPKRNEFSILYGFLIALLCNTHAMMCGVVGILGIYMLFDLFDDIHNKLLNKNQLLKRLIGLFIAGMGVLAFLLQVSQSIFHNDVAVSQEYSIKNLIQSSLNITELTNFLYRVKLFIFDADGNTTLLAIVLELILYILTAVAFFIILFLLRKSLRIVSMIIFSLAFQIFVNCGLWYFNPNRAAIVLVTLLFYLWIASNQGLNQKENNKKYDKLSIIQKLRTMDINGKRIISILICAICLLTFPTGIYYIYNDCNYEFCGSKQMSKYIEENGLENESIIIANESSYSVLAYNSNIKFYNLHKNKLESISYHTSYNDITEFADNFYEKIFNSFSDKNIVYYISIVSIDKIPQNDKKIKEIYRTDYSMKYPTANNHYCYVLLEINMDEVKKYLNSESKP